MDISGKEEEMEEDAEDLADEAREQEIKKTLQDYADRYKRLFGEFPSDKLTVWEIHNKIRDELTQRNLRPYKL